MNSMLMLRSSQAINESVSTVEEPYIVEVKKSIKWTIINTRRVCNKRIELKLF